jgi:hypothetical protein
VDDLPVQPLGVSETEAQRRFDDLQRKLVPLWASIDHLQSPLDLAFTHGDLFDLAACHRLHFDQSRQKGVVFMPFLRFLALAILAFWIGGLAVLGAVAAPTVFAVLQAHDPIGGRTLAGTLFGEIFRRFQPVTWVLGGLLLAVLGARGAIGPRPRRMALRIWTVLAMLAVSVGSTLLLVPRIDRIRAETTGAVASLGDDDPRKIEFNRVHGLSNGLMLLTLAAGLGLLWFEAHDPR